MPKDKQNEAGGFVAKTSHTLNPVPLIFFDPHFKGEYQLSDVEDPGLANVAASVLSLLGWNPPENYAASLIQIGGSCCCQGDS